MNPPSVPVDRSQDAAPAADRMRREIPGPGRPGAGPDVHALHDGAAASTAAASRTLISQTSRKRESDEALLSPPRSAPPDRRGDGDDARPGAEGTATRPRDSFTSPSAAARDRSGVTGQMLIYGPPTPPGGHRGQAIRGDGDPTAAPSASASSASSESAVAPVLPGDATHDSVTPEDETADFAEYPRRVAAPGNVDRHLPTAEPTGGKHSERDSAASTSSPDEQGAASEAVRLRPDDLANIRMIEELYSNYLGRDVDLHPDIEDIRTRHPNLDPNRSPESNVASERETAPNAPIETASSGETRSSTSADQSSSAPQGHDQSLTRDGAPTSDASPEAIEALASESPPSASSDRSAGPGEARGPQLSAPAAAAPLGADVEGPNGPASESDPGDDAAAARAARESTAAAARTLRGPGGRPPQRPPDAGAFGLDLVA